LAGRVAAQKTREDLAVTLGVGKDSISRPERRSDMLLLSTLRHYVDSMGGKLELVAQFPDRPPVVIEHRGVDQGPCHRSARSRASARDSWGPGGGALGAADHLRGDSPRPQERAARLRQAHGLTQAVSDVHGWFCDQCGEVAFADSDSAARYAAAMDDLVLERRRQRGKEVRRIRTRLKLTQKAAAEVFGGGVNAFSRYERGEVDPPRAVVKFLRVLDRHPELLDEAKRA
jgi:HTH-type transcriptional regulator / antitoxin MqsA